MSITYILSFTESAQCPVLQIKSLSFTDMIGSRSQVKKLGYEYTVGLSTCNYSHSKTGCKKGLK